MRIDAHQHFWRYNAQEYGWMQADWPIRKDFLPVDLEPLLKSCRLDGCIAVQARQSLEETRWLLELADSAPIIRAVVGWVDLRSDQVGHQLEEFASDPKFVGVRHVVQDEPDNRFMLCADFKRGIAALKQFNLTYDILVFARQLPAAVELVGAFPEQPFVLDHLAKPPIAEGELSPWREQIEMLARLPNVMCKLSGMLTEAKWHAWREADFRPYLDVVFQAFGVDRLMFGSDWPVALLAGSYEQVYSLVSNYVSALNKTEQAKICGDNANRFYRRASS
jgi:L-fuconolactonase